LSGLPIIRDHGSLGRWLQWLAAWGCADLPLPAGPIYSDAELCLEAAIAGQGVAMAWSTLAADALKSDLCARRFLKGSPRANSTGSQPRPPSANIRVFERWLRAELAADCVV
jgi:LysR family transcriptional regulator, glycine cleavage system transcriptional activator